MKILKLYRLEFGSWLNYIQQIELKFLYNYQFEKPRVFDSIIRLLSLQK